MEITCPSKPKKCEPMLAANNAGEPTQAVPTRSKHTKIFKTLPNIFKHIQNEPTLLANNFLRHHQHVTTNMSPPTCHHQHVTTNMSPPTCHHQHVTTNMSPPTCHHQHVTMFYVLQTSRLSRAKMLANTWAQFAPCFTDWNFI